jgi:hypothetical protein
LFYTDTLAGAFTWQWPEGWEDAKSDCGSRTIETRVCGFRSRAENSQINIELVLGSSFKGILVSWKCLQAAIRYWDRERPLE